LFCIEFFCFFALLLIFISNSMRLHFVLIPAIMASGACFPMSVIAQDQVPDVRRIHREAVVIDTHTDTPMKLVNGQFDISERHNAPESRVDLPRLREGGVDAIFFALFTGQKERIPEYYQESYNRAKQMLDSILVSVERNKETTGLAIHSSDILNLSKQGKIAICIGMENGFPLGKDIARVREFYNRGVRYITLCHTANNDICDSSTDPQGPEHDGLSDFGRQVVAEMNRLGMIIDVSHVSDSTFYDVINASRAPVMASHSSVRTLCPHPRNMSDSMIRTLARHGGVIQICILGAYIVPEDTTSENYRKMEELRLKYNNWHFKSDEERKAAWRAHDSIDTFFPPVLPTIAQAVDHIDHVVKLAGIDYVGIGSDFDGGGGLADCVDVADYPKITNELVKRGYTAEGIDKIWGGNFLRVFREVENVAARQ
jgi:membrane dipeptidase